MRQCSICEQALDKRPTKLFGVISPWIREIADVKNRRTSLIFCEHCNGAFFTYRYLDSEMVKLYSDYRGENYVSVRNKWEPWYSSSFNEAHYSIEYLTKRKAILKEFLTYSGILELKSIVDIGGNTGEFIPEISGLINRYVLDLSNKELPLGVQRIADLNQVDNIDLIIYAHTLEHVSFPWLELEKLANSCKYLYVEVPEGIPSSNAFRKYRIFQFFAIFLSFSHKAWGRFSRPSAGRKLPASLLRQSEHLSFFSEQTFKVIAKKQGLEVGTRVTKIITPDAQEATVIQALFRHK